ncbi:MAG TPA: DUF2281 domain-containing protein [Herpetosiphonaceae bacterium]|nr:DUF2281 domain-containing protein [Herpetosiphonaceae bacterium]
MTTVEKPLAELVQELPPELQSRVRTYVTQLLQHHDRQAGKPLRQGWAGALRDLRGHTTSVDLQHRAAEWMAGGTLKRSADDVSG